MFLEIHLLDDNEKTMLNINNIRCIGQSIGITYIDVGDCILRVKENYEQISQAISKITMIEHTESEED